MSDALESQLIDRARQGSQAAFEALQLLFDLPVRRFIRRLIGVHDAEDDLVQDAFFALYRNLDRIEPATMLRPFLFRVVRNRAYDILRRQGRYEVLPFEEELDSKGLLDASQPPDDQTAWILLYAHVQQAMERLPETQRQAMILYLEEGLTYAQVAAATGTNIGTVKSRIHHARQTLRHSIHPDTLRNLGLAAASNELDS